MTPDVVIDIFRQGIYLLLLLVSTLVIPALIMGLIISIFQAATQINEQTLSFIPRLFTIFITFIVAGPWMMNRIVDFTIHLFEEINNLIG